MKSEAHHLLVFLVLWMGAPVWLHADSACVARELATNATVLLTKHASSVCIAVSAKAGGQAAPGLAEVVTVEVQRDENPSGVGLTLAVDIVRVDGRSESVGKISLYPARITGRFAVGIGEELTQAAGPFRVRLRLEPTRGGSLLNNIEVRIGPLHWSGETP